MGRTLLYLLLALALPVSAQIYKYTDANGNTAYSSQPPDGIAAKTLELPPLNSVETQKPGVAAPVQPITAQPANALQSAALYSAFELTDIPTEEALRANNGTFTVGVKIEPRLQRQHQLRLVLDGAPYGQSSNVPRLQLVNVDRGEHTLAVQALDGEQVVQQSPAITFSVQRVHKP
ncbi:DUF4124 domain-containing protein [Pseudomonas asplenii]|uniref:DUF4124 domain-containing protein n=1 Tax=Pseudomonas asplenii TaxID=53407 RepID=A0A1H6L6G9_9PSED|nr:DUF4124 domain-containing protein [Pseudomonas fuscovaginae]SEH83985.1 protein of unknown function [Pseudomonas fuscovaginae]